MKLGADDREAFLSALTPPAGYRLEAAIGTTYTIDLEALTAAMLTLAGYDWPDSGEAKVPTSEFIGARYALRDRFRVLFDQGRLATKSLRPEGTERMNSLDRFLIPRQQRSAFHPKVWAMKYVPITKGAVPLYRLLCASRNLTVSTCWELAVMMEGCASTAKHRVGSAVGDLLAAATVGDILPPPLKHLCTELRNVDFGLPGASPEQVEFLGQWPAGTSLWKDVPISFSRAVIVAPFVEAPFLQRIRERCKGKVLVLSTLEALAPLKEELQRLHVDAYVIREVLNDQDFGLHAKLLLLEVGGKEIAYLGSANATKAAWGLQGRNTEAVIRLTDVIRIAPFLRSFADPKNDAIRWLQDMDDVVGDVAQVAEELKNTVRAVRQEARLEVHYDVRRNVLSIKAIELPFPVKVRPFTVAAGATQLLAKGETVEFALPRASLTRVLVLTITHDGQSEELVFVVNVRGASDELFDQRDKSFDEKNPAALEQALLHLFMIDAGGVGTTGNDDGTLQPPPDPSAQQHRAGGRASRWPRSRWSEYYARVVAVPTPRMWLYA